MLNRKLPGSLHIDFYTIYLRIGIISLRYIIKIFQWVIKQFSYISLYKGEWEMNKQEILNLKPGKELDLLVVEKVLSIDGKDKDMLNGNYSTDPREIWTIIESIVKRGFIYTLSNSDNKHTCAFDNLNTHRRFIVHGSTLIEAACKAALLTVQDLKKQDN